MNPVALDPQRYSRRRAVVLILIHVAFVVHFVHWRLSGSTLTPLEFNEVMHALELGVLTAGFLLMATALLATLVFGRFFCGWGCHFVAIQDFSAWLLGKVGLKPRRIRSRALALIPIGAALYMFVWPTLARTLEGRPHPGFHLATDENGWASFVTEHFWRNLPGPGIALFTLFVAGGLLVYFAGARGFCRYACPYGVVFGLADRVAPGRIRRSGNCTACACCTAACTSGISVHEELKRYGTVVDPQCLKDFDCIAACPSKAIDFSFGAPGFWARLRAEKLRGLRGLPLREELLAAVLVLLTLFAWRGLYDLIPFFVSLAFGAIAAIGALTLLRLRSRASRDLGGLALKREGRLTTAGILFVAASIFAFVATLHAGVLQITSRIGARMPHDPNASDAELSRAHDLLAFTDSWSCAPWPAVQRDLSHAALESARRAHGRGDFAAAREALRTVVRLEPRSAALRDQYATVLLQCHDLPGALAEYATALALDPNRAETHHNHAVALLEAGRLDAAITASETAVRLAPADAPSRALLDFLRAQRR